MINEPAILAIESVIKELNKLKDLIEEINEQQMEIYIQLTEIQRALKINE